MQTSPCQVGNWFTTKEEWGYGVQSRFGCTETLSLARGVENCHIAWPLHSNDVTLNGNRKNATSEVEGQAQVCNALFYSTIRSIIILQQVT